MARSLGDDMQQDVAHGVQVRFTEQIVGPPGQCGVGRGSGDDGIGLLCLPPTEVGGEFSISGMRTGPKTTGGTVRYAATGVTFLSEGFVARKPSGAPCVGTPRAR